MLEVNDLSKRFSRSAPPALQEVSFHVKTGSICGLLGHNGAGKSTALGVMLGMVYPDAGEVRIGGVSVQRSREEAVRKVGAIFEAPAFYEYLSGWRNLQIFSAYSGGVSKTEMEEIVEWVGLKNRVRDKVGTYSHGMRQRLALAQALLPRPELLILDEPTDGLDPEGIVEFRKQILQLRDEFGLTVILSSHLLSEVEQVCDEVVILQRGKIVYEGSGNQVGSDRIAFDIRSENPGKLEQAVEKLGGADIGKGRFSFPENTLPSDLLAKLIKEGVPVEHFARREESLEELYLQLSGEPSSNPVESKT